MPETGSHPIRVLIADRYELIRAGIRAVMATDARFRVVGEAATAPEAMERALALSPQVVLLDVRLPGRSGIDLCREIRTRLPGTRVVALATHRDEELAAACFQAGASAFLLKDIDPVELKRTIEAVAQGNSP
ncbi:response regulator [Caldinitratiruptor microaerophilus]|uniref:Stage 0 sporulation protein A homolog n=1 Tax=Caldinitratiruptor microaerophilus TaxID=671077 RepID=A0AA35CIY3_9FIRM|nr:response regulator transcription factor [Caldinitratiruptor microaerophilus]BDG59319.1 hypothetical protein caldi_04090 [Caldinitratiruptor microaerophilus]